VTTTIIQLKGEFLLAPAGDSLVDYSDYVSQAKLMTTREEITIPATLGTGRASKSAGVEEEVIEVSFFSNTDASSLWAALYDVVKTANSEVDFSVTLNEGAVGTDNPKWTGTATLFSVDTGNEVGQLREQTVTLSVTGAGTTQSFV
jgi:hypothetical protein